MKIIWLVQEELKNQAAKEEKIEAPKPEVDPELLRALITEELQKMKPPELGDNAIQQRIDSAIKTAAAVGAFRPPADINVEIMKLKVTEMDTKLDKLQAQMAN